MCQVICAIVLHATRIPLLPLHRPKQLPPSALCWNLPRRIFQHKMHLLDGFTGDYKAVRLVYWERFENVHRAIAREKQLKRRRQEKKLWLIARFNHGRKDLAAGWYDNLGANAA